MDGRVASQQVTALKKPHETNSGLIMSHGDWGMSGVVILELLQGPEEVRIKVVVVTGTGHYRNFSSLESI